MNHYKDLFVIITNIWCNQLIKRRIMRRGFFWVTLLEVSSLVFSTSWPEHVEKQKRARRELEPCIPPVTWGPLLEPLNAPAPPGVPWGTQRQTVAHLILAWAYPVWKANLPNKVILIWSEKMIHINSVVEFLTNFVVSNYKFNYFSHTAFNDRVKS
jgi:hypothetical protein